MKDLKYLLSKKDIKAYGPYAMVHSVCLNNDINKTIYVPHSISCRTHDIRRTYAALTMDIEFAKFIDANLYACLEIVVLVNY